MTGSSSQLWLWARSAKLTIIEAALVPRDSLEDEGHPRRVQCNTGVLGPGITRQEAELRLTHVNEVLQEVIHRYSAINRHHDIQLAFDALHGVAEEVLPIELRAIERAKQILLAYRRISARDAVHLAVMEQHGVSEILSFDFGFDSFPGITRLS